MVNGTALLEYAGTTVPNRRMNRRNIPIRGLGEWTHTIKYTYDET